MILYNGLTLAYIGDAYYELKIREYLLEKKLTKVNDLHTNAITFTSAKNQAKALMHLINNFYSEEEIRIYKRGRNQSSTHKPKYTDIQTYNKSTGFEAVIGYLYLEKNFDRLNNLIETIINFFEEFQ